MLDVSLFSFVLYEIKWPSSMYYQNKNEWYEFCCCIVHSIFVYCKKKSSRFLWIMHELCKRLICFFLNFHFKILLWNPFVFPTCFLHFLLKNPSWFIKYNVVYKHVGIKTLFPLVSNVLVHVWMSNCMLDSKCNIYTSFSSLECSNRSLEFHKVFSIKIIMQ